MKQKWVGEKKVGEKKVQYPHYTPYTRGPLKKGAVSDTDLQLELPAESLKDKELNNLESQMAFRRIYDYYRQNSNQDHSLQSSSQIVQSAKVEFDQFEAAYLSMKEIGAVLDKAYRELTDLQK